MQKIWRTQAPGASSRPLFNFGKAAIMASAFNIFFVKQDILKEDYQKFPKF